MAEKFVKKRGKFIFFHPSFLFRNIKQAVHRIYPLHCPENAGVFSNELPAYLLTVRYIGKKSTIKGSLAEFCVQSVDEGLNLLNGNFGSRGFGDFAE